MLYVHVCVFVHIYVCLRKYVCVYMSVCMYVCMYDAVSIPQMWEACGPLLTLVLQPAELSAGPAPSLVELPVNLLKHLLHLP